MLIFLVCLLLTIGGCSDPSPTPVRGDARASNFPLRKTEPDSQPLMKFDPTQPYRLEFGRGSGSTGLDTIAIDENSQVVLHRMQENLEGGVVRPHWETASSTIDATPRQRIAALIRDLKILELEKAYHADVADGSQWVFWLVQGEQEKSIYFDNHFPEAIQDFAVALDRELKPLENELDWRRASDELADEHSKDLWASLNH
jgi:hypothetical protein